MRSLIVPALMFLMACGSDEEATGEPGAQQGGAKAGDAGGQGQGQGNRPPAGDGAGGQDHQLAGNDHGSPHGSHEGHMQFNPAPEGATVAFGGPANGAEVTSPVQVKFNVNGMMVSEAGAVLNGQGHHHLIIDGEAVAEGEVVPADDTHIHYGKGQTEAEINLEAGEHTLTMQFADGRHRSYGPKLATSITITVTGDAEGVEPNVEGNEASPPDSAVGDGVASPVAAPAGPPPAPAAEPAAAEAPAAAPAAPATPAAE